MYFRKEFVGCVLVYLGGIYYVPYSFLFANSLIICFTTCLKAYMLYFGKFLMIQIHYWTPKVWSEGLNQFKKKVVIILL